MSNAATLILPHWLEAFVAAGTVATAIVAIDKVLHGVVKTVTGKRTDERIDTVERRVERLENELVKEIKHG